MSLIRTLPPAGFLSEFTKAYAVCDNAVEKLLQDAAAQKSHVELAIRLVLDVVVTLASHFDSKPPGVTYGANVMLFVGTRSLDDETLKQLKARLHFVEPELDIRALHGVLDLQLQLSTTTATPDPDPDNTLVPVALPIPVETQSRDRLRKRVLPGAPLCFVTGQPDGYADTSSLEQWCRTKGDFSESVCGALGVYFRGEGQHVRSFFTLPIRPHGAAEPIGVLNLHRDAVGLLKEQEQVKLFVPLMEPFLLKLVKLLRALERKN